MADPVITIDHVSKKFRLYHERHQSLKAAVINGRRSRYEEFWALEDVSCEVFAGQSFGIIGSNGSGKSTLLKCLTGILTPDKGSLSIRGTTSALLELGAGFHPELSGRENIYLNGAILGMGKKLIDKRFESIVDFSGLERFIDQPLKNYSSGMYAKLGFSVAIHAEPEILIVDEVLSVGDEAFRRKSSDKITAMRESGATIVFVSHGLSQVRTLCDRVMWLEKGVVREIGAANDVLADYVESATEVPSANPHGARWGTGEIKFSSIEMFDRAGHSINSLSTGEGVEFRLRYIATEPIPRPVVSFALFTNDGFEVSAPTTMEHDSTPEVLEGIGEITVAIDQLPLHEGTYDLSVALHPTDLSKPYDLWHKPFRFEVVSAPNPERRGLITLYPKWWFGPIRTAVPWADAESP